MTSQMCIRIHLETLEIEDSGRDLVKNQYFLMQGFLLISYESPLELELIKRNEGDKIRDKKS